MKQTLLIVAAFLVAFSSASGQNKDFRIFLATGVVQVDPQQPTEWNINPVPDEVFQGYFYRIIQFNEIPSASLLTNWEENGLSFHSYLHKFAYLVRIPVDLPSNVDGTEQIRAIFPLSSSMKISTRITEGEIPDYSWDGELLKVQTQWWKDVSLDYIKSEVQQIGGRVGGDAKTNPGFLEISLPANQVQELAEIHGLVFVEPADDPGQPEDIRGLSQHRSNVLNIPSRRYDGTGVKTSVREVNYNGVHVDHINRIDSTFAGTGSGNHGILVTGAMAGAGNIDPKVIGMAPGAFVYRMDYIANFQDETVNLHLNDTLVITNSSYSNGCNAGYTTTTRLVDEQAYMYPKLTHVFSAGNSGTSNCGYGAGSGWGNVTGGHKMAKNVITVAALNSTDGLAGFSSRGPAHDGRIKPDISGFGQGVRMSNTANTYTSSSGTSFSAPAIAGVAAQLYHAYRILHNQQDPDAALIKALMLNTADDLGNPGPDFEFGWGRVNAGKAADALENQWYLLSEVTQSAVKTHTINVPAGVKEVRVMVYWPDPEASTASATALVNNLDITAQMGATSYLPLILDPSPNVNSLDTPAFPGVDSLNNMEQIRIVDPSSGNLDISVNGTVVPFGIAEYYLTYTYIYDEIDVTYPLGDEPFESGETQRIRWDAFGNTGDFSVEYSTDNGTSWNLVSSNVNGNRRYYDWNVPNVVTGDARIRISRGNISGVSDTTFNIIGVPENFTFVGVCPFGTHLTWDSVGGATHYDIFMLADTDKYMDSLTSVVATPFPDEYIEEIPENGDFWIAVRARKNNEIIGRRTIAIQRPGGRFNCPIPNDAGVFQASYFNGGPFFSCTPTQAQIAVVILNESDQGFNFVPVAYQLGNEPVVRDTFNGFIGPGGSTNFLISQTISTDTIGEFPLKVWVEYPGDSIVVNDTFDLGFDVFDSDLITLPWRERFEDFQLCSQTPNCGDENCELDNGWFNLRNGRYDAIDWRTASGSTPTNATGPFQDYSPGTPGGKYLYLEASGDCNNASASAITPCIDLLGTASPRLEYWYHMRGGGIGELHVDVNVGGTWFEDVAPVLNGNQGFGWRRALVDLSLFMNQKIVLRFRAKTGLNEAGDIAIDNISVTDVLFPPVAEFDAPLTTLCVGEPLTFNDFSYNFPTSWNWKITPNTVTFLNSTSAGFPAPTVSFDQEGTYKVELVVGNSFGADTMIREAYIEVSNGTAPDLAETFEAGLIPPDKWSIENTDFGLTWNLADVTGPDGMSTKAAFVDNFNYSGINAVDGLTSWIVNLEQADQPILSFDVAYRPRNDVSNDVMFIQVSDDCGASYNHIVYQKSDTILATLPSENSPFYPASAGDWRRDTVDLSLFVGSKIRIRFVNRTFLGNNLFLDNIQVQELGQRNPVAGFMADPDISCSGTLVLFEEQTSGATPANYAWDFGTDASPQNASTAGPHEVSFATGGTKYVTLTVDDGAGNSNSVTRVLEILPTSLADFDHLATGTNIQVFSEDTSASTHFWDFGDGFTSTDQNPAYSYPVSGIYTITHIVSSANGCPQDTASITLEMFPLDLEDSQVKEVNVYPNPSSSNFTFTNAGIIQNWRLLDLNGKEVNPVVQKEGSDLLILNLEEFPSGVYIVEIESMDQTARIKLVKI